MVSLTLVFWVFIFILEALNQKPDTRSSIAYKKCLKKLQVMNLTSTIMSEKNNVYL